ncbi:MAG: chitobiase/beta-hexosaminidase C-terminal domain-containing protein [Chthoniobacteraceae bacterium]
MKPAFMRCGGVVQFWIAMAGLFLVATAAHAQGPSWWTTRGVLTPGAVAQDFGAANQGQLKNFAQAAMSEMNADLTGGAGNTIPTMINAWTGNSTNAQDFSAVTLGQLKAVTQPFYDRLATAGYGGVYPWSGSTIPANDYAMANIGQLKNAFNFFLPGTQPMDVVFIIDNTGSMGNAINAIKNIASPVLQGIQNSSGNNYRIGVVVPDTEDCDVLLSMSENNGSDFETAMSNLEIAPYPSGDHTPESTLLCLHNVLRSGAGAFRSNVERIIILITDALPSGTEVSVDPSDYDAFNAAPSFDGNGFPTADPPPISGRVAPSVEYLAYQEALYAKQQDAMIVAIGIVGSRDDYGGGYDPDPEAAFIRVMNNYYSGITHQNNPATTFFNLDNANDVTGVLLSMFGDVNGFLTVPVISPSAESFANSVQVTITSTDSNESIYYTTDGSTPSATHGTLYTGAITISATTTITAVGYKNSFYSNVTSSTFTLEPKTAAPSFTYRNTSVTGGNYTSGGNIGLVAGSGATIRYTTDGSTPSFDANNPVGLVYDSSNPSNNTGLSNLNPETLTVKAIARIAGYSDSVVSNLSLNIYALSITSTPNSTSVTLTGTIATDWIHWENPTSNPSFNHKKSGSTAVNLITNYTAAGATSAATTARKFSWSDGTPTTSATLDAQAVSVIGAGNGFSFSLPSYATQHTLKVYVDMTGGSTGNPAAGLDFGLIIRRCEYESQHHDQHDLHKLLLYHDSLHQCGRTDAPDQLQRKFYGRNFAPVCGPASVELEHFD